MDPIQVKTVRVCGALLAVGGAVLAVLFGRHLLHDQDLASRGERATGRVVSTVNHVTYSRHRRYDSYAPVVEFPGPDGTVRFTDRSRTTRQANLIGDVEVAYDPDDPSDAVVVGDGPSIRDWVWLVVGAVVVVLGLAFIARPAWVLRPGKPGGVAAADD